MKPETVWLFPELSIGVVIHRGSVPIITDDTSDIRTILVGAEDPEENRSMDHYLEVQARRESKNSKDLSRFGDAPLLPERLADDPRANLLDIGKQREKSGQERQKKFPQWASKQLDKAKEQLTKTIETFLSTLPKPTPDFPDDLTSIYREQLEAKMQQFEGIRQAFENPPPSYDEIQNMKKDAALKLEEGRKKAFESMKDAISKMPQGSIEEFGISREELISQYRDQFLNDAKKVQAPKKLQPTLSEMVNRDKIMASLQTAKGKIVEQASEIPDSAPILPTLLEPIDSSGQELSEKLERLRATIHLPSVSRLTRILHHFAPPDPNPDASEALRHQVLKAIDRNEKFTDQDLRGADLSGLDLSGVDFSEADLIGTNFSGSNLSQASFSGAWAAHANFSRCRLDHTDFSGASLGCSDLSESQGTGTSFAGAFLTGAVLIDATLKSGDFSKADLFDISIRRSVLHQGQFAEAKLLRTPKLPHPHPKGLPFSPDDGGRLPIEDSDFTGSRFVKALFHKIDFVRMDFAQCAFEKTTFLECTGPGTRFDETTFKNVAFPKSTAFPHSSFVKADLSATNLRGVNLEGGDFRGATLTKMDGSEGNFRSANLSGVQAVKAQFLKADLKNADARGGNFKEAIFLKADLRGVDFSHGSLYKAGFTGAQIDRSTLWDRALIGKTTLSQERSS
ncbi:MAG: pentapeptide repeat-containing protein [Leptospirales bacterium]